MINYSWLKTHTCEWERERERGSDWKKRELEKENLQTPDKSETGTDVGENR